MTVYTCERCHYTTDRRDSFKYHLQKNTPCPPTHSDTELSVLLENLMQPKKFQCEQCEKSFSFSRNLTRHIKSDHPSITSHSHNATENHTQSHNTTNTTTQSHNTTNTTTTTQDSHNNNNNTVNNIVNLNVFGKEELGHILNNEEFLTKCVKHITGKGLQEIIKSIWCNKDVPENHNVELKRERKPRLVNVYIDDEKGKRWTEKLADEVIDDMIQKGTGILQVHNNKLYKFDEDMTDTDTELHDIRSEALSKIKTRTRGYGKKRDSVLVELKNHKKDKKTECQDI
jgi:hypothetical protein